MPENQNDAAKDGKRVKRWEVRRRNGDAVGCDIPGPTLQEETREYCATRGLWGGERRDIAHVCGSYAHAVFTWLFMDCASRMFAQCFSQGQCFLRHGSATVEADECSKNCHE